MSSDECVFLLTCTVDLDLDLVESCMNCDEVEGLKILRRLASTVDLATSVPVE